nr:MAG TPA_asm: hypothetical protein [Caudoviricetes sp.]
MPVWNPKSPKINMGVIFTPQFVKSNASNPTFCGIRFSIRRIWG